MTMEKSPAPGHVDADADDRTGSGTNAGEKVTDLTTAIETYVPDGSSVAFGGMGGRDPEAAAREIVRQGITGLSVLDDARTTLLDIMVGAGCVDAYLGSWVGTSLISQGHNIRRAVENDVPHHLQMRDVSNFGSSLQFLAGAMDVPFVPTRSMLGTDIPTYNDGLEVIEDPYGSGKQLVLVPAARPDVAIIHVQRCDALGNAQLWGNVVNDHLKARAAKHTIVTCESIVPTAEIRRNPELTRIPYYAVDAVVEVPFGAHPWHCYGCYYADLPFYREYGLRSRDREDFLEWLDEWILPHEAYLERVGAERLATLEGMEREINVPFADRAVDEGALSTPDGTTRVTHATHATHAGDVPTTNPLDVERPDETAADYSLTELLAVAAAREIRDGETAFIGVGMSLMSGVLAKYTHAPNCQLVTESGYVGSVPPGVVQSISDSVLGVDALVATDQFEIFVDNQRGAFDVGIIGAGQIDRRGNTNSTVVIGDRTYDRPKVRLPGAGGSTDIMTSCGRTVVMMRQQRRAFATEVDYVTAPGHLEPSGRREELGFGGGGPSAVITDMAVYGFEDGEMVLETTHPGVSVDDVRAAVQWDLRVADDVGTTGEPTRGEVAMLRAIDPADVVLRGTDYVYEVGFEEWSETVLEHWKRLRSIHRDSP